MLKTLPDKLILPATFSFETQTTSVSDPFVSEKPGTLGGVVLRLRTKTHEPPTKDSVQDDQPFGWSLDDEDPAFMSELIRLSEDLVRMSKPEEPKLAQSRYAVPRSDEEVNKARTESVPKTTKTDTAY